MDRLSDSEKLGVMKLLDVRSNDLEDELKNVWESYYKLSNICGNNPIGVLSLP